MGNVGLYLDGREIPRNVPYSEPDQNVASDLTQTNERVRTNIILTGKANEEPETTSSDEYSRPSAFDYGDGNKVIDDTPYKKINRKETIEAMRKKSESENKKPSAKASRNVPDEVVDEDREMCLFNHATPRLVYLNDVPETHFIFNGEEFDSLEDLFDAKDRYGELLDAMLEQDEQCEDLYKETKSSHTNANISGLSENADVI